MEMVTMDAFFVLPGDWGVINAEDLGDTEHHQGDRLDNKVTTKATYM